MWHKLLLSLFAVTIISIFFGCDNIHKQCFVGYDLLCESIKCSRHEYFYSMCAIPGYANDTYEVQGDFHQRLINETYSESEYEKCHLYVNVGHNLTSKTESCTSWVYDKSLFTETLGAKVIYKWA